MYVTIALSVIVLGILAIGVTSMVTIVIDWWKSDDE